MKQTLFPTLNDLRAEHVLVQAWKKTATYLRQHSWYADTLELDYQSLRLPDFIRELQERLQKPEDWVAAPLEIVPAPKSQPWKLKRDAQGEEEWNPVSTASRKIRPLAHVALQDQVLATAMLLCLADQVERRMGDPLLSIEHAQNRKRVLAYGHRLFCDPASGELRHRWGSSKLYRLYYRDYQTFLRRPEVVKDQLLGSELKGQEVTIVQSDLSKFYDRVRPTMLHDAVQPLAVADDPKFFALLQKVFAWGWKDQKRALDYAKRQGVSGFESVALPQGLVASGFFANVAMQYFGNALRDQFDQPIDAEKNFILKDACYYVDDLRLVILTKPGTEESEIEGAVHDWLQRLLDHHAKGLVIEKSKTKATVANRKRRFLVQQSKTAKRIQHDVSGVFDMLHGTELIGAIEGFFHTQKRYSSQTGGDTTASTGLIVGIADMRDDTAARFAAGKFRRTFRSLRPLLQDEPELLSDVAAADLATIELSDARPTHLVLSKQQLDERGQLFAATLIEEWVCDPGNVRLLRLALDLYPDVRFLEKILKLLEPGWMDGGSRGANREVRLYCLAEIFRAGATETGMVTDHECLPGELNLGHYHERLRREATKIILASLESPTAKQRFPWYLLQQVFLYLAAQKQIPEQIATPTRSKNDALVRHRLFAAFIAGKAPKLLQDRAIFLILAHSAFGHDDVLRQVAADKISPEFMQTVCEISPETARALWDGMKASATTAQQQMARSLGLESAASTTSSQSLAEWVVRDHNPFWQEDNLLNLASGLLEHASEWPDLLSPWQVQCEVDAVDNSMFGELKSKSVAISGLTPRASRLFSVPSWCESAEEKRRFQLGMLLRFALRGSVDLYSSVQNRRGTIFPRYRLPVSHWEKQRYATFQGRSAFGPPWIPISSWVEDFLFDLLRWPGSGISKAVKDLSDWTVRLGDRIKELKRAHGPAAQVSFLEQAASWPDKPPQEWQRPLRVGSVQSVIPDMEDYGRHLGDPELNDPAFRARQRRHLASVMEAVNQMLQLRETHQTQLRIDGRVVDLLVFPELAVHPLDIDTLILPFVRTHKCMALFGQVYHRASSAPGAPLINSCLWMIPEWSTTAGFQVKLVEQGKAHLTTPETLFTPPPSSFRPAQWIVEYQWHSSPVYPPLKLSASICYDATDLALASDLKSRNDVYIVCALNQDVGTFDRMSEGLHYHMYQGVIVVNNGQFGGSSFYMPFGESFHRQVFHLHGQPQASIAFAEITPEKSINRPDQAKATPPVGEWKTPPANWSNLGNSPTL